MRKLIPQLILIFVCSAVLVPASHAITVHALYTASCQRQIGIIVGVNDRQVQMLNLNGDVVTVDRFEVIYHATYPLDTVPVKEVSKVGRAPRFKIWTYQGGELRPLVTGWPVDFSQDKVSFLSLSGSEVVIDRTSIWKIEVDRSEQQVIFERTNPTQSEFVHPYAFASCPQANKANKLFPQQLLSDPITLKREFDRLADGHRGLNKYVVTQKFYPIPEVYSNQTSLGLWLMTKSRYGASNNRKNNFTPLLVDEHSSGPFSFQSEFKSGSGPILQSIHEETQTQIFYRFKADYFHMSMMADPNLVLVGSKYKWSINDLDNVDIRAVESTFLEMGFDYGPWALEFYMAGAIAAGASYQGQFDRTSMNLGRIGLRYQGPRWTLSALGGSSSPSAYSLKFARVNFDWQPNKKWRAQFSAIQRNLTYDGYEDSTKADFVVDSSSQSFASYIYARFRTRYWAGGLLSVERVNLKSGLTAATDQSDKLYPKVGAMISLSF